MSTKKRLTRVQALEQRRAALLAEFGRDDPFVVGTVSEVHARCGKPGCQCVRGPGHPVIIQRGLLLGRESQGAGLQGRRPFGDPVQRGRRDEDVVDEDGQGARVGLS